jgi:hypothetical protein
MILSVQSLTWRNDLPLVSCEASVEEAMLLRCWRHVYVVCGLFGVDFFLLTSLLGLTFLSSKAIANTPAFCHLLECAEIGEFYLSLTPHTLCSKIHCSFYLEEPGQGGQPT